MTDKYIFSRQRRRFGRQPQFSDLNQLLIDIPPDREIFERNYILRNPINRGTQLSGQDGWSECLTENAELAHHGMTHLEGGWPKDVNYLDEEQPPRHRKKVERDDNWAKQVLQLTVPVIAAAKQNAAVDIYQDYFIDSKAIPLRDNFQATKSFVYKDTVWPYRPVVQLGWAPSESSPNKFLSVRTSLAPTWAENFTTDCHIWDITNTLKAVNKLTASSIITKAAYCPKDENLIAGGLKSGAAAIWDSRIEGNPQSRCPLETSHRDAVTAVCWVHSKSNMEFYTGSLDGTVSYWDGRKMRRPFVHVNLDPVRGETFDPTRVEGCTALEFEYTIPIRYIAGTHTGKVFLGNRKAFNSWEVLAGNFHAIDGPIRHIERNPFFVKNFMVIAAWYITLWTEECKEFPITRIQNQSSQIYCGCWSPTRCSLFVTGHEDGSINFWDLLLNQKSPVYTMSAFNSSILSLSFKADGIHLLVGTRINNIFLVRVDKGFVNSRSRDRTLISSMMERELQKVKSLESRTREIKLLASNEARSLTLDPSGEREVQINYESSEDLLDRQIVPAILDDDEDDQAKEEEVDNEGTIYEEYEGEVDLDPELTELEKIFITSVEIDRQQNIEKPFELENVIFTYSKLTLNKEANIPTPKSDISF